MIFGGDSMTPSLADIAAVTGRNNDGLGGGNGWWVLVILFALWNRGGLNGNNNGNGGCCCNNGGGGGATMAGQYATQADLQRGFDNQTTLNKLNGLENGLCSLGYDQQSQIHGITDNINNVGNNIIAAIASASREAVQRAFDQVTQMNNCCCKIENLLKDADYNRAADTCKIITEMNQATQSIMQNCNNNYRQIHDELFQMQMDAKDTEIARLSKALDKCDTQSIADAAVTRAVGLVRPQANPAYIVPNPNAVYVQQPQNNFCNNPCNNGNWFWWNQVA